MEDDHKTSLGIDENIGGLLCYLLGWVSGIAFLILEKGNRFIRFHAMQSLVTFAAISVASMVFGVIPYFGWLISMLLWVIGLLLWVILMFKALKGEWFKLPIVGDFAERFIGSGDRGIQPETVRFCSQCGNRAIPGDSFCGQCGAKLNIEEKTAPTKPAAYAATAADKEPILKAIEQELSKYPQLSFMRSKRTDLEISSVLADANWVVGKKKIEYSACLLVKEMEHIVVFWEMIKESGSGMDSVAGFKTESFKSGKTLFGKVKGVKYGPDSKIIDYTWDYGKTRSIVEQVVKNNGWKFKPVIMKGKAIY